MKRWPASSLLLIFALASCGRVSDLKPARGQALPVKPMMAREQPDARDLLSPPPQAQPERIDELLKRSEPRQADPFDLPPPTGGDAPPQPAGQFPETQDNMTDQIEPGR